MADKFRTHDTRLSDPASNAFVVTPDDATDLTTDARFLYVGVSGDITCDLVGGDTGVLFAAVPVGVFPFRVRRVRATGTTASSIVGAY